jgi:archaellum component FlaC
MIPTMMNTHKAYKSLQQAGVDERQAEVLVEIFAEMQQEHALTKADLSQAMEGVIKGQQAFHTRVDRLEDRVDQFEKHVNERFEQVDKRFEQVDKRFDQVDKRFDQVDKRFEKLEARFDHTDSRISGMNLEIVGMKKELQWLKRVMMAATCAIVLAASKYIFLA